MAKSATLILAVVLLPGGGFDFEGTEDEGSLSMTPVGSEVPAVVLPGQTNVRLLSVCDEWAVWRRSQLIESTRHHRKQSFHHAYYLLGREWPAAGNRSQVEPNPNGIPERRRA
jgi:hypothetical protein